MSKREDDIWEYRHAEEEETLVIQSEKGQSKEFSEQQVQIIYNLCIYAIHCANASLLTSMQRRSLHSKDTEE